MTADAIDALARELGRVTTALAAIDIADPRREEVEAREIDLDDRLVNARRGLSTPALPPIDLFDSAVRRISAIETAMDRARLARDWPLVAKLTAQHWRAVRYTLARGAQ